MRADLANFVHGVRVPGGEEPASWASRHSSGLPQIVPEEWPESSRMALVVVYRNCPDLSHDCTTSAFLVTRPEAMAHLADHSDHPQLWFRLPRALFTPETCPSLSPEHWPPEREGGADGLPDG